MATAPVFATTPNLGQGQLTTANTARDGSGTLVTVFTAGANGSRVDLITVTATVTTATGLITLFINNGSTSRFWREIVVPATTTNTTAAAYFGQLAVGGLNLPTGYSIQAAPTVATGQPFNVLVQGANF